MQEKDKKELDKVNMEEYGSIALKDPKRNHGKGNPINLKR